jgi:fumarate hydratase class II
MIAVQVMANDVAVGFGGAGGYLEMNIYKPLIVFNITHSITIMTALKLGFVTEDEFDRVVDPAKMVKPYLETKTLDARHD